MLSPDCFDKGILMIVEAALETSGNQTLQKCS